MSIFKGNDEFMAWMGVVWVILFGTFIALSSTINAVFVCCVVIGFLLIWEFRDKTKIRK
jgi:uncharacterized membrane protein YccF (DUF307 family)